MNWGPTSYQRIGRNYDAIYPLKLANTTTYRNAFIQHKEYSRSRSVIKNITVRNDMPTGCTEAHDMYSMKELRKRSSSYKPSEEVLIKAGTEFIQFSWAV